MDTDAFFVKQGEIEHLEYKVEELGQEIKQLLFRRTGHLRRLNDLRASTAIFPPEVLISIFEHACSDNNLFPITLGAVSSHWRNVAWSYPQLWTSISISPIVGQRDVPRRYLDIIQLYFRNAKHMPISLQIRDIVVRTTSAPARNSLPREDFLSYIFHDIPIKLRGFCCTGMDNNWWVDISHCVQPDQVLDLETLELGWSKVTRFPIRSPFLGPRLTRVSLSGPCNPVGLPWKQLTCVQLSGMPIDQCLSVLLECPLLEDYRCDFPQQVLPGFSVVGPALTRKDVVLSKLENLGWWFLDDGWSDFLLHSVKFPSLKHLHSLTRFPDPHHISIRPLPFDFVKENAPCLQTFSGDIKFIWRGPTMFEYTTDLDDVNVREGISGILAASHLQELHVQNVDTDDLRFIFDQLAISDIPSYGNLVPRLKLLSIQGPTLPQDLFDHDILPSFMHFLSTRRSGSKIDTNECSKLECLRLSPLRAFHPPFGLSGEMRSQFGTIRKIIDEGLRVELVGLSGEKRVWN